MKGTQFEKKESAANGGGGGGNVPIKVANKGRIGLAGAPAPTASKPGLSERSNDPTTEGTNETEKEGTKETREEDDKKDGQVDLESIPVFKGFGGEGRPHGRIPIPMEKFVDEETGEERMRAKQP